MQGDVEKRDLKNYRTGQQGVHPKCMHIESKHLMGNYGKWIPSGIPLWDSLRLQ